MEYFDHDSPEQTERCRRLWQAVVLRLVEDAKEIYLEGAGVEDYPEKFRSSRFLFSDQSIPVLLLAGYDPEEYYPKLKKLFGDKQ